MQFHPVAEIFPMMSGEPFEELCADIRVNGLREDIFLAVDESDGTRKIADGRNRFNACVREGVGPRFREWDGTGDLVAIVVSLNLRRRHLTESQRAMVAGRLANMPQGERTDLFANLQKVSQTAAAKALNVSPRSVSDAKKVIESGDERLIAQVDAGELRVSPAAAQVLSKKQEKRIKTRGRRSAREILIKHQTRSVKRAFRLGCLRCDRSAKGKATKEDLSGHFQYIARNQPHLARYVNDAIEEIESEVLSDITRENYDKIWAAAKLGYQTEDLIAAYTKIDRKYLSVAVANMLDYNMLKAGREVAKTPEQRGALKVIYLPVDRSEWDHKRYCENETEPDGELTYEMDEEATFEIVDPDFPEPDVYLKSIFDE